MNEIYMQLGLIRQAWIGDWYVRDGCVFILVYYGTFQVELLHFFNQEINLISDNNPNMNNQILKYFGDILDKILNQGLFFKAQKKPTWP